MPRSKQLSPKGMGNTPSQLYVVAKVLKDRSLIKEHFYTGNPCSRGHTLRRLNEHWCLNCAASIISGKLGVNSINEIKGDYYSPYLRWLDNVDNKSAKECWYRKNRKTASSQPMPSYKKKSNQYPEYVTPGKAAYSWFWGDIGGLKVEKICKDPYCVNPFHVYSCFNYHDQIINPAPYFNLDKEEEIPFYDFQVLNYMTKQRAFAPVHEFVRLRLNPSYASKALYIGFPCPWGHKLRHKEDHWCYYCVKRIMANQVGFDINYLISSYRHELNKYLPNLPFQNLQDNPKSASQDECWELPAESIQNTYRFYKYDTEWKKDACMTFPKMVYTLFWGDIGCVNVRRTCKNKRCYNPRHYVSAFHCPDDPIPAVLYANFTTSAKKAASISTRRKRQAKKNEQFELPWEVAPAYGVMPLVGITAPAATTISVGTS